MKILKNEKLKMTKIGNDFDAKMPQKWKMKGKMTFFSDKIFYKIKIDPLMMRIWYENV